MGGLWRSTAKATRSLKCTNKARTREGKAADRAWNLCARNDRRDAFVRLFLVRGDESHGDRGDHTPERQNAIGIVRDVVVMVDRWR